jgi:hypothetical protein
MAGDPLAGKLMRSALVFGQTPGSRFLPQQHPQAPCPFELLWPGGI